MNNVRNIIFDLGGVVIDLDRSRAVHALEALGLEDAFSLLGEYGQKGAFYGLETGELPEAAFYDTIMAGCIPGTTALQVARAFEQFLVELPVERLKSIRELREDGYRVFVLSNTNPVMYNGWIGEKFRQEGKTVNDYFDGIVVSFQERTCKPDPVIFRNLIERYRLNPAETLMLDDSAANCEAARSVGLQATVITKDGADSFSSVVARLQKRGAAES